MNVCCQKMVEVDGKRDVQIVLKLKEGTGFSFVKTPFVISASLYSQKLETDPVKACSNPELDCELIWELEKKLLAKVRNVPVKVEVFSIGVKERRDRIGYLILSLPCHTTATTKPATPTWHKLLGVSRLDRFANPQLRLSLSLEDPKEMTLMLSEPSNLKEHARSVNNPVNSASSISIDVPKLHLNEPSEWIPLVNQESCFKHAPLPSPLTPKLSYNDGVIQIGSNDDSNLLFSLNIFIETVENLDLLLLNGSTDLTNSQFHINYTIFSNNVRIDRYTLSSVKTDNDRNIVNLQFNQHVSLKLNSSLLNLIKYFACSSYITLKLSQDTQLLGVTKVDLRAIIPFGDHKKNNDCGTTFSHSQRCFLVRSGSGEIPSSKGRKPFTDIQVTLKEDDISLNVSDIPTLLKPNDPKSPEKLKLIATASNNEYEQRLKSPDPDIILKGDSPHRVEVTNLEENINKKSPRQKISIDVKNAGTQVSNSQGIQPTKSESKCTQTTTDKTIDLTIHDSPKLDPKQEQQLMHKVVAELDEWKKKQQELFKAQLKSKEDRRLELLLDEWTRKRTELEDKLKNEVEQCQQLVQELTAVKEELAIKGIDSNERQKTLAKAKMELEVLYNNKYQDLRQASKQLEEEYICNLKASESRCLDQAELTKKLKRENADLKEKLLRIMQDMDKAKKSGLNKDQATDLLQELRSMEEKLESAEQAKKFFKDQWSKAMHEIHICKLQYNRQSQQHVPEDMQPIEKTGLERILSSERTVLQESQTDLQRLKEDLLALNAVDTGQMNLYPPRKKK